MELTHATNRTFFTDQTRQSDIPATIVSKLLTAIIGAEKRDIVVEGGSQHFVYNTETTFAAGKYLRLCMHDVQMNNNESSLELNLKGRVKNSQGRQQTCSIYIFLWWDHTRHSPLRHGIADNLQLISLLIEPAGKSERLCDSVFEFDLFTKEDHGPLLQLSQIRGYLVLGPVN